MLPVQVLVDVDGLGPANFETFCQRLNPPARARIIETGDDGNTDTTITYQCQWTLDTTTPIHVQRILSRAGELKAWAKEVGGQVQRLRIGVPFRVHNANEFHDYDYLEWIVPMTARNRSNAYRGLRRRVEETLDMTVELNRDYLEMMESNGSARFFVSRRLPKTPMKDAIGQFEMLNHFLAVWRNSRVLSEPWGLKILYDSSRPNDV